MAEEARGRDGDRQEEAGLGDGAAERRLGERGRGRRLQPAPGPQLGRREDHAAAQEAQDGRAQRRPAAPRLRERGLLLGGAGKKRRAAAKRRAESPAEAALHRPSCFFRPGKEGRGRREGGPSELLLPGWGSWGSLRRGSLDRQARGPAPPGLSRQKGPARSPAAAAAPLYCK